MNINLLLFIAAIMSMFTIYAGIMNPNGEHTFKNFLRGYVRILFVMLHIAAFVGMIFFWGYIFDTSAGNLYFLILLVISFYKYFTFVNPFLMDIDFIQYPRSY